MDTLLLPLGPIFCSNSLVFGTWAQYLPKVGVISLHFWLLDAPSSLILHWVIKLTLIIDKWNSLAIKWYIFASWFNAIVNVWSLENLKMIAGKESIIIILVRHSSLSSFKVSARKCRTLKSWCKLYIQHTLIRSKVWSIT